MAWIKLNASDPAPPSDADGNVHFRQSSGHAGTATDPIPTSAFLYIRSLFGKLLDAVTFGAPSDGQVVTFDAASGSWKAKTPPASAQVQSDWSEANATLPDYIKNKPTIPSAQVQSDWSEANATLPDYIKNKPTIPSAFTASGDLSGSASSQTVVGLEGKALDASIASPADGQVVAYDSALGKYKAQTLAIPSSAGEIILTIDGGTSPPSTGSKGYTPSFPFAATITKWELLADQSGSAQVTVKKCTYTTFPTTASIVASAPPVMSSAIKASSSTLTGWTTSIAIGDILEFVLDSVTGCNRLVLKLEITKG